jgi:hypothetical protein
MDRYILARQTVPIGASRLTGQSCCGRQWILLRGSPTQSCQFVDEDDAVRDRRMALGHLVEAASYGELILRMFLCALLNDRRGAVLVNTMPTGEMITKAKMLIEAHGSIAVTAMNDMKRILDDFKCASDARNRLIHDSWSGQGSQAVQLKRERGTYHLTARPAASVAEIRATVDKFESSWKRLVEVGVDALGVEAWGIGLDIRRS